MAKHTIAVSVLADTKPFSRSMEGMEAKTSRLRGAMKGLAVAGGVGLAGMAVAGVKFLAESAGALANMERIGARTDSVLRSTGGAAGRTRDQIESLAGSIERTSGVEAEATQEGQNLLLTFTNIKGQQFDAATKSMTDMAVAMNHGKTEGVDMKGAALQLGKALNDPVKGVGALSRVGVSFTESQKKTIAAMVKTGDTAGAQKIILAELNKEFGGAADAAGNTAQGKLTRFRNAVGDLGERIMTKAMPGLLRLTDWLVSDGGPALDRLGGFVETRVVPPLASLGRFVTGTVLPSVRSLVSWFQRWRPVIEPIAGAVLAMVAGWRAYVLVMAAWKAIQGTAIALQLAWNAAMAANPIGLIILAIVGLVAAIVILWKRNETFRRVVLAAWAGIKRAVAGVVSWFRDNVPPVWQRIRQAFSRAGLELVVTTSWRKIKSAVSSVVDWFKSAPGRAFQQVRAAFLRYTLVGLVMTHWRQILAFVSRAVSNLRSRVVEGVQRMRDGFVDRATRLVEWVRGLPGRILAALGNVGSLLRNAGSSIIQSLIDGIESKIGEVRDKLTGLTSSLPDWKGPKSRDRVLLRDNGRLIMGGFVDSLTEAFPTVRRTLGALTDLVAETPAPVLAAGIDPATTLVVPPASSSAPRVVEQHVHLSTITRPTAADGRVIVDALRDFNRIGGGRP